MGNYITTKSGVTIDLNIPAVIESFSTETTSSHVTRGKLKVFSIGKTQDIRVFTKDFAESLIKSLPGTPVVAYFDKEEQDFLGHNDIQYVYGYVPEDAVPEFIQEGNRTWAVVDINLFTERDDNIGEVARQIIGKSQSLELDPDSVDWELVYINGKLEKIIFKKGKFYGLSVLGDNQTPAFEGAGFFKPEIIESLKSFTLQNGEKKMKINKNDFLSLGSYEKQRKLYEIIKEQTNKDDFYVVDFTEEEVIIKEYSDGISKWLIANYTWVNDTEYIVGDFEECIPTFVRVNKESPLTDNFAKKKEEEETNCGDIDDIIVTQTEEPSIELPSEQTTDPNNGDDNQDVAADGDDNSDTVAADGDTGEGADGQADSFIKKEDKDKDDSDESDDIKDDEKEDEKDDDFRKEKEKERKCESIPTVTSSLSNEDYNELMELRKEKKISLVKTFTEYLSKESIDRFLNDIEKYDLNILEAELKIAAFEENKGRILEKEESHNSFGVILPSVEKKEFSNELDTLVAQNL